MKSKKIRKLLEPNEILEIYGGPKRIIEAPNVWSVEPYAYLFRVFDDNGRAIKTEFYSREELKKFFKKRAKRKKGK